MKKLALSIVVCCALVPASAQAVTFRQLEAVYEDGESAYDVTTIPTGGITITGVVINNSYDITNTTETRWWQVFVQSQDRVNDYGGVALWDGDNSYKKSTLSSYAENLVLHYGDIVEVTAYTGNSFRGKFNLTDGHDSDLIFSVSVTGHTDDVPAANIDLADLKHSNGTFIFDPDRNEGCEYYQGTLVHLEGLKLVNSALWGPGNTVSVQQDVEGVPYTFDMILGVSDTLNLSAAQLELMETVGFDVTAILDQEDYNSPLTGGYRLWLTSAANGGLTIVPEPGSISLLIAAGLAALLVWRRRR